MRPRSRLAIAAIVVLAVIPAAAAPAMARDPNASAHQRTVQHWTKARMEAARSRDMVLDRAGRLAPQPLATNAGGLSWPTAGTTSGGLIARASGRVYFEMGTNAYVCSGSVVTDGRSGYSLVLTAGHCVFDAAQGWATYWMFVPQADSLPVVPTCSESPRGCWTAQALVAHGRFTGAGGFTTTAARYDYAFAVVGPGGHAGTTQLDADSTLDADSAPDSLAIAYSGVAKGNLLYAFGYPAAAPYNGTDLVYCSGKIAQDLFNGNATWSLVCNMTGGASGGPWLRSFSESSGNGTLASLNSYRYSFSNRMYGPKFSSYTQAVFNAANAATSGTISVP
jgi:V8-like Glu-specific endopeptidase